MELPSSVSPTLLLVETSEDHAILFRRIFSKVAGHWQFHWVKDGAAAVHKMMYDRIPHILVTALHTPPLDGVDVIEWVRYIKCPHHVSVLIFDAVPTGHVLERLEKLDVNEFLDKRSPGEKFRLVLNRLIVKAESQPILPRSTDNSEKSLIPGFARTHSR